MTTAKDLAAKLDGITYGEQYGDVKQIAKAEGFVIVTGYSDDNLEFEGAIRDEVGAYNGAEIALNHNGILTECENPCDHCSQADKIANAVHMIKAEWSANGYSWYISAEGLPSAAYFDILEDGEKHTRGLVFSMKDLELN